jgi:hypothetical protein
MEIRKIIAQAPEKRAESVEKMITGLRKGEDENAKAAILEILEDQSLKLGCQEKNVAIDLVEKTKMVDAIPALYPLLKIPVISGVGEKVKDPFSALVAIGKEGLPELIRLMQADDQESVPYQVIADLLYHWFDGDRSTLRAFLIDQEEKLSDRKFKSEFKALVRVVDSWNN